jgi:hypothetical protein
MSKLVFSFRRKSLASLSATIVVVGMFCFGTNQTLAQSTAFTYQGKVTDNGAPANGSYDFAFRLYDSLSGGIQIGTPFMAASRNDEAVQGQSRKVATPDRGRAGRDRGGSRCRYSDPAAQTAVTR